ncbi:flagellar biosynthetic protein FliO [Azomonas macrocytogenes]|uniref:Flagellar protein n=1 Tax=Azomonas macrocytogenes TaxID=69962 RepID=A0A839SZX8_AZOMA|nr:flagellar biosynthetic protein FliO [Azomonas macrocytogenes]MBB3101830.1 flagellar protein FliO/FliZ [Azomonas macrocytogenes]
MRGLRLAIPALLALPVMAAEPSVSVGGAGLDMSDQLPRMLLGLLVVVGMIVLLAWLLRRVQRLNPRHGQVIKLIASQALGPRERLMLVQVGKQQILLGLSAGRITPLHVLDEPVELPAAEPATAEFAQRLKELLGKDHKD